MQLARVAVPIRHGEANPLLSSQNHARSLVEDDLWQKPHRYDLPGHSHCEVHLKVVMENAEVTFMPETKAFRYEVGLEHFVVGILQRHE